MSIAPHWPSLLAAALLAMAAGCGEVVSNDSDAALPPPPDAQRFGSITVHVGGGGVPRANAPVYYHDADGMYVGSVSTDADGNATIESMPIDGWVTTVGSPFDSTITEGFLVSIGGVQPGDTLYLDGRSPLATTAVGTLRVTMPSALVGASRYELRLGCASRSSVTPGEAVSISLTERCLNPAGTVDAVVYAVDGANQRLGAITVAGVELKEEAGAKVGDLALVNLPWNTNLAQIDLTMAGAPLAGSMTGQVSGLRSNITLDFAGQATETVPAGGSSQISARMAPDFFEEAFVSVQLRPDATSSGGGFQTLAIDGLQTPAGGMAHSLVIDMASELMAPVGPVTLTDTLPRKINVVPPERMSCRDNPGPADLVLYGIVGSTNVLQPLPTDPTKLALLPGTVSKQHTWLVVAPADARQVLEVPVLPPDVGPTVWPEESFVDPHGLVAYYSDSARTYDDLRNSQDMFLNVLLRGVVAQPLGGTQCAAFSDRFATGRR